MSLHVFMMRHARTAWNESGRIQGQTNIPASAAGLAEARDWRLPPTLQPTAFWCSDLSRAQTTAAVLQDASAAPLYADARLRESLASRSSWRNVGMADVALASPSAM